MSRSSTQVGDGLWAMTRSSPTATVPMPPSRRRSSVASTRLARPWNRLRAMSVFRDQSSLAAESDLSGAITRTLDDSRFLVLLASPESAGSPWVDKEVAYWCDQRNGLKRLIVVVTDGEFEWDEVAGALTPSTDAVSPTVRSRFITEPLYVDLRWARAATELSLRESRFRSAIVIIAATIRGIAPADLESEDVRLHRRARRLARAAVATVVVLALVASIAAVVAVANAQRRRTARPRRARPAIGVGGPRTTGERRRPGVPALARRRQPRQRRRRRQVPSQPRTDGAVLRGSTHCCTHRWTPRTCAASPSWTMT